jgi:hypothetical protein
MATRVEIRSDSSSPIPAGLEYPNFPDGTDPLPQLVDGVDGHAVPHWVGPYVSASGKGAELAGAAAGGPLALLGMTAEIIDGVFSIPIEAARERRDVVLQQSLGIYEETQNEQFRESVALGFGAVLSGLSDGEIAELRRRLGSNRTAFDRAVESARNFRREHPERFAEAQRLYGEQLQAWQDGVAAALLGETPPSGAGEMARHGHAAVSSATSRGETWVTGARAQAAAARSRGFIDQARGRVDAELRRSDAAYRRGIEDAQSLRSRSGAQAVEQRVRDLEIERRPSTPVRG